MFLSQHSWASLIAQLGRSAWRRDGLPTSVFLGFPCGSAGKESACNTEDSGSIPGSGRAPWRRDGLPTPVFLGFLCGSAGKESAHNAGDLVRSLGWEEAPGEGKGYPLQYSGLENGSPRVGNK